MLKIICWRLIFEFIHVLKLFGFRGGQVHYFAYGGNLDPAVLKNRGITPMAASPASLSGFVLRFNHDVPFSGIGMGSIQKDPGSTVHGIIYTLSKVDEWILDCYESHLFLKRYRKGWVDSNGKNCFYYYSGRTNDGVLPSKSYLGKIINGYKAVSRPTPLLFPCSKNTRRYPRWSLATHRIFSFRTTRNSDLGFGRFWSFTIGSA